jgi:hypothetical protein
MSASGSALGAIGGGGVFAGAGNMINSCLHPEQGYEAAIQKLQEFFKQAQGYNQPTFNQGQSQFGRLNDQANQLNDPAAFEAKLDNSYNTSPRAKQDIAEANASGLDAASSMGLLGSSAALSNIQKGASNIMEGDRADYIKNLMQNYLSSVGIGQNLYGIGANAGNALSQNAMTEGENEAGLKGAAVNAPGAQLGKLFGGAADLGINYFTGGTSGAAKAAGGVR